MATVDRTCNYEDVDVFTIPHNRMKLILSRVSKKVKCTDFSSSVSFHTLLKELSQTFLELKQHEEIENKYIMKVLKRRLQGEALKKLLLHLHAHSHISDILNQVRKTEKEFLEGFDIDMKTQGLRLTEALQAFFGEYLPHMVEEEQVLQPLLMEFLPTDELKHIKEIVLQLHHLKDLKEKRLVAEQSFQTHFEKLKIVDRDESSSPVVTIKSLPIELLGIIFSYLGPKDLCRSAQVCTSWNEVVYSGNFWNSLHPCRWAAGDWTFGERLASDDCNCDCQPNYDLMVFHDYSGDKTNDNSETSSVCSSDTDEMFDERMHKEARILHGLARYVLPRVGDTVKTLVLECSKVITNGLLFQILTKCKNVEYLDVSQTIISDLGLFGLFKVGCHNLLYLDVSGCKDITDKTLVKLSTTLGKNMKKTCCRETGIPYQRIRNLQTLRLSGCYRITDFGLRSLSKYGGLPRLRHLDLSGCFNLSGDGIHELIKTSSSIDYNELYYCDNIVDGPFSDVAGGCQNNGCLNRVCCRTIRD